MVMSRCCCDGCSSMPPRYSVISLVSAEIVRGGAGEIAVLAQHEAVVLDHRAAARRRHQDGIETAPFGLLEPDGDVGAGARQRIAVASEMMGQRAAALLVLDQHHLDAVPRQQIDGGLIDARRQHLLGAALQQRDPSAPLAVGRKNAAAGRPRRRQAARRQRQHRLDSPQQTRRCRGRLGRRQQGASGRPSRARIMLAAKQRRAAAAPRRAPRAAPARSAAAV